MSDGIEEIVTAGNPTLRISIDKISIKSIDYQKFRDFKIEEIDSIKYWKPYHNA